MTEPAEVSAKSLASTLPTELAPLTAEVRVRRRVKVLATELVTERLEVRERSLTIALVRADDKEAGEAR